MRFRIDHTYEGIGFADYQNLHFDEAFNAALTASVKLGRTLLQLDKTPDKLVRKVKVEPDRELPGPMAKAIGSNKLSYVEEMEYEWGKGRGRWRTIPNVLAGKVDISGTLEIVATATGVRRVVEGDIKVKILGLGGMIEKFIVADVEKGYENAAGFTRTWITSHPKSGG